MLNALADEQQWMCMHFLQMKFQFFTNQSKSQIEFLQFTQPLR